VVRYGNEGNADRKLIEQNCEEVYTKNSFFYFYLSCIWNAVSSMHDVVADCAFLCTSQRLDVADQ